MINRRIVMIAITVAAVLAGCGGKNMSVREETISTPATNPVRDPEIRQFTLDNGLRVFMVVDHSAPLVAVDINYHVGSRNERPGKTGFAHLFEHMMFQGSKHYDDDYFKPLQDIGGQVNGATNTDRTRYWEIVPSPWLERALWLESDRMGFLLDAMTQERLDNQKSVVSNERRQNYDNRPYGTVWEKIAATIYPPQHPYSWLTIGSLQDIAGATREDVVEFFKTWYTPNNATLTIVGDIDVDRTLEMVDRYFGTIPPGPPVSSVGRWPVSLAADVVLDITDRVGLPRTWISWPSVPLMSSEEAAMDVFGMILGGGRTSHLYRELVYRRQVAQDAAAGQRSSQIAGVFDMVLTPRPGVDPVELEMDALAVLDKLLEDGVTPEELSRVKTSVASSFIREMENIGGFGGLADRINLYQQVIGRPDGFRMDLQRYLDLTAQDVISVARKYLKGHKVTARVLPAGDHHVSEAVEPSRDKLPGRGPDSVFDLPDRQVFHTANGMKVVLVHQDRVPLVSMDLIVPGAQVVDPDGLEGLASIVSVMLTQGADGMDAETWAKKVESFGGQISVDADVDSWFVSASSMSTRFPEVLELMFAAVMKPTLPPDELERQRAERLTRLKQLLDIPQYNAIVAAQKRILAGHPYGNTALGTTGSIKAITIDDVRKSWSTWFRPENSILVVVGDITRDTLESELSRVAGDWKGQGDAPPPVNVPTPRPVQREYVVVDMPGAHQSFIVAATTAPDRRTPDAVTLDVLNSVLGGKFVSRLNLNLREDKGYTYGARSSFQMHGSGGLFVASTSVSTDVTGPAVTEMIREISEIGRERPVTPEELRYSTDAIVNGYSGRFSSIERVASELLETYLYGLPDDMIETYPSHVSAVTCEQVNEAAAKYLAPDRITVVVAGDAAAIVPQLSAAGLDSPVTVVDRSAVTSAPAR